MAIFRCFLVEHPDSSTDEDKDSIKQVFVEFFELCRHCLEKHAVHCQLSEFHNSLVDGYNNYAKEAERILKRQIPRVKHAL
jgi:RIO-like serine/threonine protein kinase